MGKKRVKLEDVVWTCWAFFGRFLVNVNLSYFFGTVHA